MARNSTYLVNESDLLAPFTAKSGETLVVSGYGDGSEPGFPFASGAAGITTAIGTPAPTQ